MVEKPTDEKLEQRVKQLERENAEFKLLLNTSTAKIGVIFDWGALIS